MIRAVLFDFDGVLTTDATGSLSICRYISEQSGLDPEQFQQEYYKYNADLLSGRTTHDRIWDRLCSGLHTHIGISLLYESFLHTPIDGKMLTLAEQLKKNNTSWRW